MKLPWPAPIWSAAAHYICASFTNIAIIFIPCGAHEARRGTRLSPPALTLGASGPGVGVFRLRPYFEHVKTHLSQKSQEASIYAALRVVFLHDFWRSDRVIVPDQVCTR